MNTKLPWTPLVPAFGLEQFGIPTPRRNAEAWRHFDMVGMIGQNYSGTIQGYGTFVCFIFVLAKVLYTCVCIAIVVVYEQYQTFG